MDPPEEIVANKLCALIGRAEVRDLVDLYCLDRIGLAPERFIEDAARKDGGFTPAVLLWILSEVSISEDSHPPGVPAQELEAFVRDLERRRRRAAAPRE